MQLSDQALYVPGAQCIGVFIFDLSGTTGFKFKSLRISLLTVLRVVYAIVQLVVIRSQNNIFPTSLLFAGTFSASLMDFLLVSWFLRVSSI